MVETAFTAERIKNTETLLVKNNEEIVAILLIKIRNWQTKSIIPILYITNTHIYIQINSDLSKIPLNKIKEVKFKNEVCKLEVEGSDDLDIQVLNIDPTLQNISLNFTRELAKDLKEYLNDKSLNDYLFKAVPNQKSMGQMNVKSLPIIISALLLITLSFVVQSFSIVIGWFLLFGGLISALFGILLFLKSQKVFSS